MAEETVLEMLRARGFIANVSDEAGLRAALAAGPVTAYCGYDPTAASLHVGNLVSVMLLAHLQRAGHRPIALVGGATGLVGDPSGRVTAGARAMLSLEQVETNLDGIRAQLARYLDLAQGKALLLNNADWLLPIRWVEFLRDIGRHFTVNQLMQHETYRQRFEQDSLSFIELNYALLQAYDFLHLYRQHGCLLQVGGNDQWFNILAGTELIRRVAGGAAYALTSPLLTTSSGQKMGKTESGAVWLDSELTSPYDYYQFWRNTEDPDVGTFLRLFTFLPLERISGLERLEGSALNEAKEVLAFEATRLTHGPAEARGAQETAHARFRGEGADQGPSLRVVNGDTLLDALIRAGLADSRSEARRHLRAGAVRLAGRQEGPADRPLADQELPALLAVGKRRVRLLPAGAHE